LEEALTQIELANKRAKNSEEKAELVQKEKNELVREKPGYPVSLNNQDPIPYEKENLEIEFENKHEEHQ
jgi:hypothetical protein